MKISLGYKTRVIGLRRIISLIMASILALIIMSGCTAEASMSEEQLLQIATELFDSHLEEKRDVKTPLKQRIHDYKIDSIHIENYGEVRFKFSVDYMVLPYSSDYILAGSAIHLEDGWVGHFHFVDCEKVDEEYTIKGLATSP